MRHSSRVVLYVLGWSLAACAVGTGVYLGSGRMLGEVHDYSRVKLGIGAGGEPVADAAAAERLLGEQQARLGALDMTLVASDGSPLGTAKLSDLGARIDVPETLAHVAQAATRERLMLPLIGPRTWGQQEDPLVTVAPVVQIDAERLAKKALELKEAIDLEPVSARIDLDAHKVIAERAGRALDEGTFAAAVAASAGAAIAQGDTKVIVPTIAIAPKITQQSVEAIDISTVVSEFETHFSRGGEQVRRGQNIDRAAAKLDGLVLPPDQVVSFNAVVGDRSEANGFKRSWEIFKGEMVEGIGGGTCQVASTIHAASFFGGLDVLERLPHSRPSAYITMGLDSTVVYPTVDLKLRNPYPFPIVVHTKTSANTLRVELLGKERPVTVKFSRELLKRVPYTRKLVEEPGLAANRVVHKQHGIDGFRIKRFREMVFASGATKTEETTDFYPPTVDIFEVPVGFDEARLPAVPQEGEEPVAVAATPETRPTSDALAGSVAHSAEGRHHRRHRRARHRRRQGRAQAESRPAPPRSTLAHGSLTPRRIFPAGLG